MKEEHKSQLESKPTGDCDLVWVSRGINHSYMMLSRAQVHKDWDITKGLSNVEVTAELEKRSFRGGIGNKITLTYPRKTMTLLIFLLPSAIVEAASGLEWSQFPDIFHRVTWSGQPCSINKTVLREKVCLDVYELKGKRQRTGRWEQCSWTQAVIKAHLSFMSPKWDQPVHKCVFNHCTT